MTHLQTTWVMSWKLWGKTIAPRNNDTSCSCEPHVRKDWIVSISCLKPVSFICLISSDVLADTFCLPVLSCVLTMTLTMLKIEQELLFPGLQQRLGRWCVTHTNHVEHISYTQLARFKLCEQNIALSITLPDSIGPVENLCCYSNTYNVHIHLVDQATFGLFHQWMWQDCHLL